MSVGIYSSCIILVTDHSVLFTTPYTFKSDLWLLKGFILWMKVSKMYWNMRARWWIRWAVETLFVGTKRAFAAIYSSLRTWRKSFKYNSIMSTRNRQKRANRWYPHIAEVVKNLANAVFVGGGGGCAPEPFKVKPRLTPTDESRSTPRVYLYVYTVQYNIIWAR